MTGLCSGVSGCSTPLAGSRDLLYHSKYRSNSLTTNEVKLMDFPSQTLDKIRYGDTDRQGHVNNAVFATFLETGRVQILFDPAVPPLEAGSSFVLARLVLDFRSEISPTPGPKLFLEVR